MWGFLKRIQGAAAVSRALLTAGVLLFAWQGRAQTAVEVKVLWKSQAGTSETTLLETTCYTDASTASPALPSVGGYRFTRWEVTPADTPNFVNRDVFGRALENVSVVPKEDTVVTAIYMASTLDSDADGMADAEEIYWYGSLTQTATSDMDRDGYTFAQELQYGLNPHFPDALVYGGVRYGDSSTFWYNPNGYSPYVIQSNPEGKFTTQSGYLSPGQTLATSSYASDKTFGYWTIDGVRQADVFGRAVDSVTLVGDGNPDHILTVTAHFFEDADERALAYWYGPETEVTLESDTDGDGYTLAQEVQYGLNPYFKDALVYGGVRYGDSSTFWYNPNGYSPYVIQSNPEGKFETQSGYLSPGQALTTTSYAGDKTFGYWTINGARQADIFGRALDNVTLVGDGNPENEQVATAHFFEDADERALAYWYGSDAEVTLESDTDGDGYTLAQEIQHGLNPYFKDALVYGGVRYGDSVTHNVNLQPFDMGVYTLVKGEVVELFATINSLTGELSGGFTFSSAVAPAVVDVNGDGLKDILLASPNSVTLCQNIGAEGSPDFEIVQNVYPKLQTALQQMTRPVVCSGFVNEAPVFAFCDQGGTLAYYDVTADAITTSEVAGYPVWSATAGWGVLAPAGDGLTLGDEPLTLNVATPNVTSAALADINLDGVEDLLVADAEGRIALYLREEDTFVLQHRVWGGSYAGFATGLALAAIDWESDGDMDAIAGTADGHLLLLRDPGVGRPTNLKGSAGYDNVLLTWDPNQQSRVSGYKVYRTHLDGATFGSIAETLLPTYRDTPPSIEDWVYRVTTLSRQWLSGNSKPEITESLPSDKVVVKLGSVELEVPETLSAYAGQTVALPIHISNTMGLRGDGTSLTVTYDNAFLEPVMIKTTAVSENITFTMMITETDWTLRASGGVIEPGAGTFVTFVFKVKEGTIGTTSLRLTHAQFFSQQGSVVTLNTLPLESTLTIQPILKPAIVMLSAKDCTAETEKTVTIPVNVSISAAIDWESLTLSAMYNGEKLQLITQTKPTEGTPVVNFTFKVLEQHGENLFAKVSFSGSATSANGLPAKVLFARSTILITDSNPLKPAVVSLGLPDCEVKTERTETIALSVSVVGELDWATLRLSVSATNGVSATITKWPTASAEGEVRVTIPEMHGEDLSATVTVEGSAMSANGLVAEVMSTTATLTITDSNPPPPAIDRVPPWTNGDCDGDGRLTSNDYQIAFRTVQRCHTGKKEPHSEVDQRVHQAICDAIGKPKHADLKMSDVTNTYKKFLRDRGVTDLNNGNNK